MAKLVSPEQLGQAIQDELEVYHRGVVDGLNNSSKRAARKLVKLTKATAPVGHRGKFAKSITSQLLRHGVNGDTYVWGASGPAGRLTHLLVHGHALRGGGRARGSKFLHQAWDEVQKSYEKDVERVLRNGG